MDIHKRHHLGGTEQALVKRAQSGNRYAFDTLVRLYRPVILGLAYLRSGSLEVADDLTQEVLARAWQSLPQLRNPAAFPAWIKTMTANICTNWHGGPRAAYIREEPVYEALIDRKPTPPDIVFAAESWREIGNALKALPASNRLALVMHVLEDMSYEEVSKLTGVPISTVDGRIRRARAQLKRLIILDAADIRPASRATHIRAREPEPVRKKEPYMKGKIMNTDLTTRARSLMLFTNRLATLIEAGLPVGRALHAMTDVAGPYGNASVELYKTFKESDADNSSPMSSSEPMYVNWLYNADMYPTLVQHISSAIEQKRSLLPTRSQGLAAALRGLPELFSPYYIDVVYYGDNAGQLDAVLRRLASLMERQWDLAIKRPEGEDPVFLFLPTSLPPPHDWSGLMAHQQQSTLQMLMRGFAVALESGVPILHAMRLMAPLLPETAAAHWLTACQDIAKGDRIVTSLGRMDVFPDFAIQLISIGEDLGTLDSALVAAADLIEYEKAGELPH